MRAQVDIGYPVRIVRKKDSNEERKWNKFGMKPGTGIREYGETLAVPTSRR